jgi:flagellar basal body-associated protein FliL
VWRSPLKEQRPTEDGSNEEPRKEHHMNLLWIILIVVLVLALLGFFGRGRF